MLPAAAAVAVGVLASILFSGTAVAVRLGSLEDSVLDGVIMAALPAAPLMLAIAALDGELELALGGLLHPYFYAVFVAVGIIHYYAARILGYSSIARIGANVGSVLVHTSAVFTPALGVLVLGEPLTGGVILEAALIMAGVALVSAGRASADLLGIAEGLACGLLMAVSSTLVKTAFAMAAAPALGVAISSTVALIPAMITKKLVVRGSLDPRKFPKPYWYIGLTAAGGQLSRFTAISLAPISIVVPLTHLVPVFTVLLSYAAARRLEAYTPNVLAGVALAGVGVLIAYYSLA